MYYTSEVHKKVYGDLVAEYGVADNSEYKTLFYLLTASPSIRAHLADCFNAIGESIYIKEDALHHGWVTGADAKLIRLAFSLYCGDAPADTEAELRDYAPARIFSGLDERYFKVAVTALSLWRHFF